MAYSKTPWKSTISMILDATEGVVAARVGPSGLTKEDMLRIVLCVNACQKFTDEQLQQAAKGELEVLLAKWTGDGTCTTTALNYGHSYPGWTVYKTPQAGAP